MTQTDQEFLAAVGINGKPRDWWHWLRHRWSEWTEPRAVEYVGIGWLVKDMRWVALVQERWCLTCRIRERREVSTP